MTCPAKATVDPISVPKGEPMSGKTTTETPSVESVASQEMEKQEMVRLLVVQRKRLESQIDEIDTEMMELLFGPG